MGIGIFLALSEKWTLFSDFSEDSLPSLVQFSHSAHEDTHAGQYSAEYSRDALEQGSPTPGPQPGTSPQPVRNWAARQEVSGRREKLGLPLSIACFTA